MDYEKRKRLEKVAAIFLMWLVYLCFLTYFFLKHTNRINMMWAVILGVMPLLMVSYTYGVSMLRERRLGESNLELQALMDNLSAGILRCSIDDLFSVQYASSAALKLLGYTWEELSNQYGSSLASIIPGMDARRVSAEYIEAKAKGNREFSFEFRIRHKSGKELWVSEQIKIAHSNGGSHLFAFLMDITSSKMAQNEKKIRDACYQIIYETSDEAIFDYDVERKEIVNSGSFARKFGWDLPSGMYPQAIDQYVHSDDQRTIQEMFMRVGTSDEKRASGEIRLKDDKGNFLWCAVELFGIVGEGKRVARIIGKIKDVDKIKRETMQLMESSIQDPMTGILNKAATKNAIENFIKHWDGKGVHAFLIMDIDDFKRVNDRFGHMEGDRIIKAVADMAQKSFCKTDIVGRIGGDEFVNFLKDIATPDDLDKKVKMYFNDLKDVIIGGEYPVSVSIGIAMFPTDATDHDGLYRCADLALYRSKHAGKNTFESYTDDMKNTSGPR